MERSDHLRRCRLFYQLHQGENILLLPNAWDAGSAVLMQYSGFPAIATTSAGIAFANGFSDNEVMGRERMIAEIARIIERVNIPVSADLETGYGHTPEEVGETVKQVIDIGASGANIEDGKTSGDNTLIPAEQVVENILAAKESIKNAGLPFILNARVDTYLRLKNIEPQSCLEETLLRANAYIQAGADCIFIPGVTDKNIIARLAKEIDVPLNVLGAYSGKTIAPLSELQEIGVKRVTIGGSLALYALAGTIQALEEMKQTGTFSYADKAITNAAMNTIMSNSRS